MKPGIKTTEFWLTLVNAGVMVAVAFGLLQEEQGQEIEKLAAPLIAAVLPVIIYVWGRAFVKANG